ncbi:unnamed protein product [Symbiodinium sp. CCMP2456]|nr:unnamed protein product [Symbiodinium sp. CCMP2456]
MAGDAEKSTGRGVWIRLRHVTGFQIWAGTAHFTPGCTQPQHAKEVHEHLAGLPPTSLPVLFSCDLNAEIAWGFDEDGICRALGNNGKTEDFLGQSLHRNLQPIPPRPQDFTTPTSRPRQAHREGRQIDCILASKGVAKRVHIHKDSYMAVGTDHELLSTEVAIHGSRQGTLHSTLPRVWISGPPRISQVTHSILVDLAKTTTKPRPGHAYKDPAQVKEAFSRARGDKLPASWTAARNLRKKARRHWEQERLQRATAGDWAVVRQLRPTKHRGWDATFAEAQNGKDPHQVVHEHLESIYTTGLVVPPLPAWEGEVVPFTEDELRWALSRGKPNKAVGVDGTSHELLQGVANTPGGFEALLAFYNEIYAHASIPQDWNVALMIVIPKEEAPVEPASLRPLAMGSAASKVYSRLLLGRTVPWLQAGEGAQCSGEGKQPAEYVFGMSRVMELEAEWHKGLVAAKIDIRKAFDMLHRPALLSRLKQAIGDGPTFRSWQAMLADTTAVLQTSWGCSRLQLDRGIRQGSVESPILFGWLAALILRDVKCKHAWQDRHRVFDQLECQDLLFMDDGLLWAHTSKEVSRRLEEWAAELAVHGLKLNPAKCKAYFSPYCVSQSPVSVNGNLVPQVETLEVMGVPFRVGASASELLAPFLARGRDKFWSLKHLLRARTPLTGRILLLDKIIGGTSLWCLSALAPDASALALLNSMQLQCVVWAMRRAVLTFLSHDRALFHRCLLMWGFLFVLAAWRAADAAVNAEAGDLAALEYDNDTTHGFDFDTLQQRDLMAMPDGPHRESDPDMAVTQEHPDDAPPHEIVELTKEPEHDGTNLMQAGATNPIHTGERASWEVMLANLQHDLEMLPKPQRAEATVQLLRWLDYRATDKEQGYFLGHMKGRTADLTALLVAALDDTGVDASTVTGPWCSSWVLETRRRLMEFIPCHEGSHESWGKPMEKGMPCIMLFGRPPPTNTPPSSPGLSAVVDLEEEQQHGQPSKRRCLAVELSSGSGDAPRLSRTILMPFPGDDCSFQVNVRVEETDESEAATDSPNLVGFRLPEPAPGDLAASGISMSDFMGLWTGWRSGSITYADVARVYGDCAAQLVQGLWADLPSEAYLNPSPFPLQQQTQDVDSTQTRGVHATQGQGLDGPTPESHTNPMPDSTKDASDDEGALLTVVMRVLPVLRALAPEVPVVCQMTTVQLAASWIRRLRQQGLANVEITSCLLNFAQARANRDYMLDWEDILLELDLEDVPRAVGDMLQWVEAEMWEDYVDRLEGLVGWESQQVSDARGVANMPENVRREWRQRAERGDFDLDFTVQAVGRRVRPRRAQGRDEEEGLESDAQSLMERPRRRGDRRDDSRSPPGRQGELEKRGGHGGGTNEVTPPG